MFFFFSEGEIPQCMLEVGSNQHLQVRVVENIVLHQHYNKINAENDIALITVSY